MVRVSVWFSAVFIVVAKVSGSCFSIYSRILSKITIVSFIEYPKIVSRAAMKAVFISNEKIETILKIINASCVIALIAASPKFN